MSEQDIDAKMKDILTKYKKVAVYGMSTNPEKAAHGIPKFMLNAGLTVYPVNPRAEEILEQKSYPSIMDVEGEIEILNVFKRSEDTPDVIREAIARKEAKGDVKAIWLQLGIANEESKKLAEDAGIEYIEDKCIMVEYGRLIG